MKKYAANYFLLKENESFRANLFFT